MWATLTGRRVIEGQQADQQSSEADGFTGVHVYTASFHASGLHTRLDDATLARLCAGPLSRVRALSLAGCTRVTSEGLTAIATLSCLHRLDLGDRDVDGPTLRSLLASLPTLTHLSLHSGRAALHGAADAVACAPALCDLSLPGCKLDDSNVATWAGSLPHLMRLDLSHNDHVSEQGLHACLPGMPRLRELLVDACAGVTGGALRHVPHLHALHARRTGVDPSHLSSLTCLRVLDLSRCPAVTDASLAHLAPLSALHSLRLQQCDVSGAGLAHLRAALGRTDGHVVDLDLSGCRMTDEGLLSLAGMRGPPALRSLSLSFNRGVCRGLRALAGAPRLTRLVLRSCRAAGDDAALHAAALPRLRALDMCDCEALTDAGVAHLRLSTSLEDLDLRRCPGVSGDALAHLGGLTRLTSLRMGGAVSIMGPTSPRAASVRGAGSRPRVGDEHLAHVAGLTALRQLEVAPAEGVTDAGLATLSAALVHLTSLRLTWCERVTGAGLEALSSLALVRLDLTGCRRVSGIDLAAFSTPQGSPRATSYAGAMAIARGPRKEAGEVVAASV